MLNRKFHLEVEKIKRDILIVGAGVVGLSIAKALAESGKKVTLVDQSSYGTKASGTNLGQLSVSDRKFGLEFNLVKETFKIYEETNKNRNIEYENSGGIAVLESEEDLEIAIELVKKKQALGYNIELLVGENCKKKEPYIENIYGAVYSPEEGKVNPFQVNSWLLDEGVKNGLEFLPFHKVEDFIMEDNTIKGVTIGNITIEADTVILATGSWSRELMKKLDIDLDVNYVRGSAMVTQPYPKIINGPVEEAGFFLGTIPEGRAIYFGGIQTENGSVIISQANRIVEDYDTSIDLMDIQAMAGAFLNHFPVLKNIQILRTWSGVTTTTPDEKPYWGFTKNYPNLFLAIAFKGAFSIAPAVGKYTAEWINNGDIDEEKKIWSPALREI